MPCETLYGVGTGKEIKDKFVAYGDPMEILYQRRSANFVYVVPKGLRELMSDISREVIRMNPKNLYIFISDYLHTLMVTRENAKVAMRFVEDVEDTSEMLADFMKNTNLTRYKIEKSARIIQRTFRRLVKGRKYENTEVVQETAASKMMERLKITLEEANKSATVIQNAYHVYKVRKEQRFRTIEDPDLHMPFSHIDWKIAAQRTFDIFNNIRGVRKSELHKPATLIQAAYRGYYTRKFIKDYGLLKKHDEVHLDTDDEYVKEKKDWAARVLQRFFRCIVRESKKRKTASVSISTRQSSVIDLDQLQEMEQVLAIDDIINAEETEVDLRVNTSEDFEEKRDRSARVIQNFFRKAVAMKKTKFPNVEGQEHDEDIDSVIYEIDTEIEDLFKDDENV